MKKALSILALVLLAAFASFAQARGDVSAAKTKEKTETFEREKFDPAKDPAADLLKAIGQASADGKRIILDVGGEWCGWCRHMDKFFFQNPELAALKDKNYVWLKVNMSEENKNSAFLSTYPVIGGYPHLFILDEKGKLLQSQNTGDLEAEKTYDLQKFTDFLKKWAPGKKDKTK